MTNPFDGLSEAGGPQKGIKLKGDAIYELEVVSTGVIPTRKHGDAFLAKFRVVSSSAEEHAPGFEVEFFQILSYDSALQNVKDLAMALIGLPDTPENHKKVRDDKSFNKNFGKKAIEDNGFAGTHIHVQTATRESKARKDPLTGEPLKWVHHKFSPSDG